MLTRIFECLQQQRWFDTQRPFEYTVNFTRGACVWLLLTRQGVPETYVKFSEHISLLAEAQRYAAASRHHAQLVPRFVGHARCEGLEVLVCEAVDYLGLNVVRMRSPDLRRRVLDQLLPCLGSARGLQLPAELTPLPNRALAAAMQPYFDATPQATHARRWLGERALDWIASQPDVPQHGDLALNNLGLRADGSVILFDWEDLGAISLPGLDLFTLELSLEGSVAAMLQGRHDRAGVAQSFVRTACDAMDLSAVDYLAMTQVYALVVRYLKRNYGPLVRARMDELLEALARESGQI